MLFIAMFVQSKKCLNKLWIETNPDWHNFHILSKFINIILSLVYILSL